MLTVSRVSLLPSLPVKCVAPTLRRMRSATSSAPWRCPGAGGASASPAFASFAGQVHLHLRLRDSHHRRVGKDDGELVSAVAGRDIELGAKLRAEHSGHLPQDGVAGQVPVTIVEGLEVIKVDHQQRHRRAVPPGPGDLLLKPLVVVAVVEQARETVGDRLVLHAPVEARVLDGHCGLLAEGSRQGDLLVAPATLRICLDEHHDAERLVTEDERHVEVREIAVLVHDRLRRVGQLRV